MWFCSNKLGGQPPGGRMTLTIPANPLLDSVILMEQRLRLFGRTAPRLGTLALRVFGPYPLVDSILSPPHHVPTSKIKYTHWTNSRIYLVCLEDIYMANVLLWDWGLFSQPMNGLSSSSSSSSRLLGGSRHQGKAALLLSATHQILSFIHCKPTILPCF